MTMLPEYIINKIMLFVSHPIADMINHYIDIVSIGRSVRISRHLHVCRGTSNHTLEDRFDACVYGEIWFYKYNVQFISGLAFGNKLYQHFHKDKIARLAHNEYVRNVQNNDYDDDDNYDEYIHFELASVYDED